jgi:hypothetical protein
MPADQVRSPIRALYKHGIGIKIMLYYYATYSSMGVLFDFNFLVVVDIIFLLFFVGLSGGKAGAYEAA